MKTKHQHTQNWSYRGNSNGGFTLIELLTVLSIIAIVTGIIVNSAMGTNPAGARQGAISQISQSLDEARMDAIENGTDVYFAIAGMDSPDPSKRLHAFILYRMQTAIEQPDPTKQTIVQLTAWQSLPQGIYFDPDTLDDNTCKMTPTGLPGNPPDLQALEFGSLGQVEGATNTPVLSVVPGALDPTGSNFIRKPGATGFSLQIYRLTGRVNLTSN